MEMFTVVQYMWYSLLCQAQYLAASMDNKLYGLFSRHLNHTTHNLKIDLSPSLLFNNFSIEYLYIKSNIFIM